jgi:hypothetical protein
MTPRALWRRQVRGPHERDGPPPAAAVLGARHPIARAARARHALALQASTSGALAIVGVVELVLRGSAAVALLSSALVVELAVSLGFALAQSRVRAHARDFIAGGDDDLGAAEISAERARLASPRHRERLARDLERAMHAAAHWRQLPITSRPPPTVRHLLGCMETARAITCLVRDPATSVRGVAVLDRLLCGGYTSALYAGDPDHLARELGRIRFLLETERPCAWHA